MEGHLVMTAKERRRKSVFAEVQEGRLTLRKAAEKPAQEGLGLDHETLHAGYYWTRERYGIPQRLYVDKKNVYVTAREPTPKNVRNPPRSRCAAPSLLPSRPPTIPGAGSTRKPPERRRPREARPWKTRYVFPKADISIES